MRADSGDWLRCGQVTCTVAGWLSPSLLHVASANSQSETIARILCDGADQLAPVTRLDHVTRNTAVVAPLRLANQRYSLERAVVVDHRTAVESAHTRDRCSMQYAVDHFDDYDEGFFSGPGHTQSMMWLLRLKRGACGAVGVQISSRCAMGSLAEWSCTALVTVCLMQRGAASSQFKAPLTFTHSQCLHIINMSLHNENEFTVEVTVEVQRDADAKTTLSDIDALLCYVDRGQYAWVSAACLYVLSDDAAFFPAQTTRCSLARLEPKHGDRWSADALRVVHDVFASVADTELTVRLADSGDDANNASLPVHIESADGSANWLDVATRVYLRATDHVHMAQADCAHGAAVYSAAFPPWHALAVPWLRQEWQRRPDFVQQWIINNKPAKSLAMPVVRTYIPPAVLNAHRNVDTGILQFFFRVVRRVRTPGAGAMVYTAPLDTATVSSVCDRLRSAIAFRHQLDQHYRGQATVGRRMPLSMELVAAQMASRQDVYAVVRIGVAHERCRIAAVLTNHANETSVLVELVDKGDVLATVPSHLFALTAPWDERASQSMAIRVRRSSPAIGAIAFHASWCSMHGLYVAQLPAPEEATTNQWQSYEPTIIDNRIMPVKVFVSVQHVRPVNSAADNVC